VRWRLGLALLFLYAAGFSLAAWTAETPVHGPGAFAVMVLGFLLLGLYLLMRWSAWLSHRQSTVRRGFPVLPPRQPDNP
jgi:hypothetical protein